MNGINKLRQIMALIVAFTLIGAFTISVYAETSKAEENFATIKPTQTELAYEPLNNRIKKIVDTVTTDDMSDYEKLKACYDWIYDNIEYSSTGQDEFSNEEDWFEIGMAGSYAGSNATATLIVKKADCVGFSYLFAEMAYYLGYRPTMVHSMTGGLIKSAGGGYAPHTWVTIKANKVVYIFDPMMEVHGKSWTGNRHYFFATTYEQQGDRYQRAEIVGDVPPVFAILTELG